MSDTGGFPLVGGSPAFPGKNNVVRDGSCSNSFGCENLVVGSYSFAAGIRNRVAKDWSSAVGNRHVVTGSLCFSSGDQNTVSSDYSSAFGQLQNISGSRSFGSGTSNTVSGSYSAAFGASLVVSGSYASAFGQSHTASGSYSFSCGTTNTASGILSCAFGLYGLASRYNEIAHGGGLGSILGYSQHGWLLFSNQSTSVTPVILYLNGTGATERAVLAAGARWKCTLEIIATTTGAIDKSASWEYKFQIDRPTTAATTIIRTTPLLTLSDGSNAGAPPAGWSVAITADTTNGCPQIQVTGDTDTINWTCALHYVQSIRV